MQIYTILLLTYVKLNYVNSCPDTAVEWGSWAEPEKILERDIVTIPR